MPRFEIRIADDVAQDLAHIDRKHHAAIQEAIIEQLSHQPLLETRNKKSLDPALYGATHELRCGMQNRYRVLYRVMLDEENATQGIVQILIIGEKHGEKLVIGREEI